MKNTLAINLKKGSGIKILTQPKKTDLIISSKTSLRILTGKNRLNNADEFITNLDNNLSKLNKFIKNNRTTLKNKERIIGFGTGKTTDISKYIAYKCRKDLIIIPSIISTNAFSTDKSALICNKTKKSIQSSIPNKIIFDSEILNKSESKYNLFGLCDVFSIHTALFDWQLSHIYTNESIDQKIYNTSEKLLQEAMKIRYDSGIVRILPKVVKLVSSSGLITNIHGSGRPESGSEHIFAKKIESVIPNIPHAVSVCIGILLMSYLQNNYSKDLFRVIKKIGILKNVKIFGINKKIISGCLYDLKPREDRFTIIDLVINDEEKLSEALKFVNKLIF